MTYKELREKAEKEKSGRVLTPAFVKMEAIGSNVTGKFVSSGIVTPPGENQTPYLNYLFDTDSGLVRFHLGSQTDKELAGAMLPGGVYSITYREDVKLAKGRHTKKYDVIELAPATVREPGQDDLPI
jgi:hypothetical protein